MTFLNANPEQVADRPFVRADYFAKANLAERAQRDAVEQYLQRGDVAAAEKAKFLRAIAAPGSFVSDSLLSTSAPREDGVVAGCRHRNGDGRLAHDEPFSGAAWGDRTAPATRYFRRVGQALSGVCFRHTRTPPSNPLGTMSPPFSRRDFLRTSGGLLLAGATAGAQVPGERGAVPEGVRVLNPSGRVPVGLIIDDSTCLVNLNRFAMPQFDTAFAGANPSFHQPWREWPVEIPDNFVRKFAEWATEHGVKGKYSIVPFPACVGRMDRMLPGWTPRSCANSLDLVRTQICPNWDIHPEMVTHTRVIDLQDRASLPGAFAEVHGKLGVDQWAQRG